MTTAYPQQRMLPTVYIQDSGRPLGAYGLELLQLMKEQYPDRYWQLSFDGTLMERIRRREEELMDLKLRLMEELEHQSPRPKTDSFLAIANHMNGLAEQASLIIQEELKKPV